MGLGLDDLGIQAVLQPSGGVLDTSVLLKGMVMSLGVLVLFVWDIHVFDLPYQDMEAFAPSLQDDLDMEPFVQALQGDPDMEPCA